MDLARSQSGSTYVEHVRKYLQEAAEYLDMRMCITQDLLRESKNAHILVDLSLFGSGGGRLRGYCKDRFGSGGCPGVLILYLASWMRCASEIKTNNGVDFVIATRLSEASPFQDY